MKNYIIIFNDGSTAQYWNTTAVDAMCMAYEDWHPHKQPVSWEDGAEWKDVDHVVATHRRTMPSVFS